MQKVNQPKVFTTTRCSKLKAPSKNKNELHLNTHTKEWMLPPIVIAITKSCLFRFQRQERIQFNLFNYNRRIRDRILEYTVIPFLPNSPNRSKPNNSQE